MVRTGRSSISISIEERQAAAEALHESIATQVEALKESGEWERFLAFAGAFHSYSLSNVLLILSQYPTATKVAGFRKWQALGRQVRRGEKGIRIFGYRTVKTDSDTETAIAREGQDGTGEQARVRALYPMLSVFDIEQTDPIDPTATDPTELAHRLEGEDRPGSRPPSPTTAPPPAGPSPARLYGEPRRVRAAAYCRRMELALSTTPRETWVWTDSDQQKEQIEVPLADAGCLVLPTSEPHPEPRALNIDIGVTALDSLQALAAVGASFRWHQSQHELNRGPHLFGVPVQDGRTANTAGA